MNQFPQEAESAGMKTKPGINGGKGGFSKFVFEIQQGSLCYIRVSTLHLQREDF